MKRSFHKFVALTCTLFFSGSIFAQAAEKLPIINEANGFVIPEASDAVALARIEERWIVAGSNGEDASWLALFDQKGNEIWRIFPVSAGQGGEGFVTTAEVDTRGIIIAGLSQNPLILPTAQSSDAPQPSAPTPLPSTTNTPSKSVPLVNPDNVTPVTNNPFRKDIANIFLVRVNLNGKLENIFNSANTRGFVPNSIATIGENIFLSGNELGEAGISRGGLLKFASDGTTTSYTYGASQTTFNRLISRTSKTLSIIGSSAETLANRKVVGKRDGIILDVSPATGAITKVLRSSGKGASRSWDSATGNLLVAGTSQVGAQKEGVVTSFTAKGAVSWTLRFPKSEKALARGNCIATGSLSSESFLYIVDTKGKQIKGARLPNQELLAVATTPAKGCAILTAATTGGIRLSYL